MSRATSQVMPQDDHAEKLLRSTRTFLSRWQGVSVRVRWHGPSLSHVLIVLSRETRPDSQALTLALDPLWWHGYFEWNDARLGIELVDAIASPAAGRTKTERLFKIVDPKQ